MEEEEIISDTFFNELTNIDKTKLLRVYTKNRLNYNSCKLEHVGNDYIFIQKYSGDLVYIKISEISNLEVENMDEESTSTKSITSIFSVLFLIASFGYLVYFIFKISHL